MVVADRDGEAAKEVADAIVKANGAASAASGRCHRHRPSESADGGDRLKAHGRLDVLVNNAGVGERADFRHLVG